MKQLYLILSIIFSLLILFFLYLNLTYETIKVDNKIHKQTLSLIKTSNKTFKGNTNNTNILNETALDVTWEENLFDPLRGNLAGSVSSSALPAQTSDMELIGICNTLTLKGAIILQKRKRISTISLRNKSKKQPSPQKRFYKVDERLSNGYILEEVNTDSVTLRRGNEQITIKLKFDDIDSGNRLSSGAASSVKTQLKKIRDQKNLQPQKNKPKTSVKITPFEQRKINKKGLRFLK